MMRYSRYIYFGITILVGIGLGLLYGWVLNPVELVDSTPSTMRIDYQTDYVLMAAEVFHAEQDPGAAVCRLARLGGDPLESISAATVFAVQEGYTPEDLVLIDTLAAALEDWDIGGEVCQ